MASVAHRIELQRGRQPVVAGTDPLAENGRNRLPLTKGSRVPAEHGVGCSPDQGPGQIARQLQGGRTAATLLVIPVEMHPATVDHGVHGRTEVKGHLQPMGAARPHLVHDLDAPLGAQEPNRAPMTRRGIERGVAIMFGRPVRHPTFGVGANLETSGSSRPDPEGRTT